MGEENSQNIGVEETLNKDAQKELTLKELLNSNRAYQSQHDKMIEDLLKGKKSEWHKEWEKQSQESVKEAERLAKLTEKEKLEEYKLSLEKREKEIARKELEATTKDLLIKENLPTSFASSIISSNLTAEEVNDNIKNLKKVFSEEVEKAVKASLAGATPKQTDLKADSDNYKSDLRKAMGLK